MPDEKPCAACPWTSKDQRDIDAINEPATKAAMESGMWFACHVNMGTCYGAALRCRAHESKVCHGG
jgi:hypothetical protein